MSEKTRRRARLILVQVFLVSAVLLAWEIFRTYEEQIANWRLARQVRKAQEAEEMQISEPELEEIPGSGSSDSGDGGEGATFSDPQESDSGKEESREEREEEPEAPILPQYEELWEENHDLAGWLSIEDTRINYPVMYTPKDPEFYLHRGFDGKEAVSGTLFIGAGWSREKNHVIIYGHHMKNGSMFGNLDRYAQESYAQEHPVIRFDTLREEGEYEVIAAFYGQAYDLEEVGVFRYYRYIDLSREEDFDKYLSRVREAALYDTGVEVEYGDDLLTLSTCSYHTEDGRFVVVARRRAQDNAAG